MIKFTFNGRSLRDDFEKEATKAVLENVKGQLRERLSAIRHPETGEFPTVAIAGDSLDSLSVRVEGTAALLGIVRERLGEEGEGMAFVESTRTSQPRVFLCYGSSDLSLAERIAAGLQSKGIDTWWDKWMIQSGDSLRQKIDAGLADCTHFVALLTRESIKRPWVNLEIDAALMLKLQKQAVFIPLRNGIRPEELPPLLRGIHSPEVNDGASDLQQLISDIHGVTQKPLLGPAPPAAEVNKTGFSAAASAIARVFVEKSETATFGDVQYSHDELMAATALTRDDLEDGLHELTGMVRVGHEIMAKEPLFATFDQYFRPWNPSTDALQLAADMLNDDQFPARPSEIAARYGWTPRRLNPAINYLDTRALARVTPAVGMHPWACAWVQKTEATRRFVKSRR